jgi:hypothetical protein
MADPQAQLARLLAVDEYGRPLDPEAPGSPVAQGPAVAAALGQTWPARAAQSAWEAVKLPADVYAGRVDPMSDEGIGRAFDMAGLAMTGGVAGTGPGGVAVGTGPIRAYHGSPHDFDRFDLSRAGTTTDSGHLGRGLYFSTDPRVAERAAHKYEVEVGLASPLEVSLPDFRTDKRHVVREALGLSSDADAAAVTAALKHRGHDGVLLDYSPTGYNAKEVMAADDRLVSILRKYGVASFAALPPAVQLAIQLSGSPDANPAP